MKERVTTRLGTANVVLVAPHGHDLDDSNTGVLALACAEELDAYAVVNNGWRRAKKVDEIASEANCNNSTHVKESVVKAEFYDPIIQAIADIQQAAQQGGNGWTAMPVYVLMVHGIGNSIRAKAGDPSLDLIVGFGAGDPPRETCGAWRRDMFIDLCQGFWKTYAGAKGGDYSAHSKTNLTQKVRRDTSQHVLQLEFVYSHRNTESAAKATGKNLAIVMKSFPWVTSYTRAANVKPPLEF